VSTFYGKVYCLQARPGAKLKGRAKPCPRLELAPALVANIRLAEKTGCGLGTEAYLLVSKAKKKVTRF